MEINKISNDIITKILVSLMRATLSRTICLASVSEFLIEEVLRKLRTMENEKLVYKTAEKGVSLLQISHEMESLVDLK